LEQTDQIVADFEKSFPGGPTIRSSLSLPLGQPHVVVLFGPSGAGKSTVLRCIAGLERPDHGRIQCGDEKWFGADERESIPPYSRSVGYLFQDYALFPHLTVLQNIAYPLRGLTKKERAERVEAMMHLWKLEGLGARYPAALSGGQQQRVALARALIRQPKLLLLDEPLSALDLPTREELRGELRRVLREWKGPTLLVTHDPVEALNLGDRLAVMTEGRIQQVGLPEEVFSRPANERVAAVVGVDTVMIGRKVDRRGDLIALEVNGVQLWAVARSPNQERFYLSIRSEDVTIERGTSEMSSARNHLKGRVREIQTMGAVAKVKVDCAFLITALITRQSIQDLGLAEGVEVVAKIKATAVHLIPIA
jgi:molybdate transport system ATP-binding protein